MCIRDRGYRDCAHRVLRQQRETIPHGSARDCGHSERSQRSCAHRFFAATRLLVGDLRLVFACSGRRLLPVSRFHSSYVCGEIFPSTRSCANLRRCAWLLKGIMPPFSIWWVLLRTPFLPSLSDPQVKTADVSFVFGRH